MRSGGDGMDEDGTDTASTARPVATLVPTTTAGLDVAAVLAASATLVDVGSASSGYAVRDNSKWGVICNVFIGI